MADEERWEYDVLRELALEGVRERRRARRWGIFFKLLLFVFLFSLLLLSPSCSSILGLAEKASTGPHTAVVDVDGEIAANSPASAENIIDGLEQAFDASGVKGIILRINSPGGSPVQAGRVNDALQRLKAQHPDIPVYAVAGDMCTSGAYYIAVGADAIYADKASLVGSIGVIMSGFGFNDAMSRLGVERRLYTAGRNKAFLDPFSPPQKRNVEHAQGMLDRIHQQFIETVKKGRGARLKGDPDKLFSGLFWTGQESLDLGLIDGLGGPRRVARDVIGAPQMVNYTPRGSLLERMADRIGASAGRRILSWAGLVPRPQETP
ncbi:MAG TPA: S49 family peptidase [Gammaproteobacteria bacterium]|nr:S49 family peptidase [Gammaproteobacteria bacterium]